VEKDKIVSQEDLNLINQLTRKELSAQEVYTFPVVCCDNQIDRDNERFSDDALEELAKLYVGHTIIKDHDPKTDNQAARIYRTQVESGENGLKKLVAYAYVPVIESTKGFIEAIETGLKKEVSVGCAVRNRVCSVCGESKGYCSHIPGKEYDGMKCFRILSGVTDAYEVSFVAVPAQKNAGVIKSFDVHKTREDDTADSNEGRLRQELLELELSETEKEFDE
jgi:hypothetical protein